MLILYIAVLLNTGCLVMDPLGFYIYKTMSSENRENLASNLPIWTLLISFWIRVMIVAIFVLFLVLMEVILAFSLLVLAVDFPYVAFIVLKCIPSITIFRHFIIKYCWLLSNAFLCLLRSYFMFIILIIRCLTSTDFHTDHSIYIYI